MNQRPILKWTGSKYRIRSNIIQHLPPTPRYLEPYLGTGSIATNLPWRPQHMVLNDMNGDIVNLFHVLRTDADALIRVVSLTPWAEEEHRQAWECADIQVVLDDLDIGARIERARSFLVRQWMNHGGVLSQRGFRHRGRKGLNSATTSQWRDLPKRLVDIVDVLMDAEIFNRPAIDMIRYYNTPDTLIFADPPYPLSTRNEKKYYTHEMTDGDHLELIDALSDHPGPVVLCGYHCPLYDEAATPERGWSYVEYEALAEKGRSRTEVLWLRNVPQHTQMSMF